MAKSAVLLLNLGGPETLADVQPFLYNLFADPELMRMSNPSLQKGFAWLISTLRAGKSKRNYQSIGGGSPLLRITHEQAQALQASLIESGFDVPVYVGMRYWTPLIETVVEQIKADNITQLVVLPLYPQYSITTTGSSFKLLDQLWQQDPTLSTIQRVMLNTWYDQPTYVRAMAKAITQQLDQSRTPEHAHVLFSAHGIPESYVSKYGDPYQQEMEACIKLIWKEVDRPTPHSLSYQSRVGPVEWLGPYTEDQILALAEQGVKDLIVVPISFISDHIETLQEIDMEYREIAEGAGILSFRRVPTLNTTPAFITALKELVQPHLETPKLESSDQVTGSYASMS